MIRANAANAAKYQVVTGYGKKRRFFDSTHVCPVTTSVDVTERISTLREVPAVKKTGFLTGQVDRCYRSQPFPSERHRIEYLFELYQQLTASLIAKPKKPAAKKTKNKISAPLQRSRPAPTSRALSWRVWSKTHPERIARYAAMKRKSNSAAARAA